MGRCIRRWLVSPIRIWKPFHKLDSSGRGACWLNSASFACSAFVFGCVGTFVRCVDGTFMNQVSPSWSVRCCGFPCCNVDVEVLQVGFEGVFVALTLASYFSATMTEIPVQQLLGYPAL